MANLPEMELLQYIYKTADMGCEGIDAVEKHAEQKLMGELKRERIEYESIRSDADQMIRKGGDEPAGSGMMAKMSADVMTAILPSSWVVPILSSSVSASIFSRLHRSVLSASEGTVAVMQHTR